MPILALRWIAAGYAALFAFVAEAGTVEQAALLLEPQMQVNTGAVAGCGFRLRAMPVATSGSAVLFDGSFNLYAVGVPLLKGGAEQLLLKDGKAVKSANRPIESFWFMAAEGEPTTPLGGKLVAAEAAGYLLYGVEFAAMTNLFSAVMDNAPMTIGFRVKGEPVDRIYTGSAIASDEDKQQSNLCMERLIKRMRAALNDSGPTPSGK